MLTDKQEFFCENIAIKKISQRQAYLEAYPRARSWKLNAVDAAASRLAKNSKVLARLDELRARERARVIEEARWEREDAFRELSWMLEAAHEELEKNGLTSQCVYAVTQAVKGLNALYCVSGEEKSAGVVKEIVEAIKGVSDD